MSEAKKGNYLKIGSVLKSRDGEGYYLKLDDFNAEIYLRVKETEGNLKKGLGADEFYKIDAASLFNPFDTDPDFVAYNVCVNFNGKSVKKQELED